MTIPPKVDYRGERKEYQDLLYTAADRLDLYRDLQASMDWPTPSTRLQVALRKLGDAIVDAQFHPILYIKASRSSFLLGFILGAVITFLLL